MTAKRGHVVPCHQLMHNPTRAHLLGGQDLGAVGGILWKFSAGLVPQIFSKFSSRGDPVLSISKDDAQPPKALVLPWSTPPAAWPQPPLTGQPWDCS